MPARRLAAACSLLLLALPLPAAAGEEPPARPDLAGRWLLDARASDGPAGRQGGDGSGGGGPRREGGPTGGEREGTGGRGGGGMGAADAELELRRQGEGGYTLLDQAGHAWLLPADGREREAADAAGRTVWLRSEWDLEGRLVVRRVQDGIATRVDTFALDPADGALVVTRRLSGERGGAERRLVYRRAAGRDPITPARHE